MSVILRAPNTTRLIKGKPVTYLTSPHSSGTTLTVDGVDGFATSQMVLIGELGAERSTVVQVSTSTAPSGTTITLNASLARSFPVGTPVRVFDYDQVEFSRATTLTGSKSVLTTVSIAADDVETIYEDTTNTTGFGFYRLKNSSSSAFTDYSDAIPYAGYDQNAAYPIFQRALSMAAADEGPRLTYDHLFTFLNDFLAEANSRHTRYGDAAVYETVLTNLEEGVWEIDLPTDIARKNDASAIIEIRLIDYPNIQFVDQNKFGILTREMKYTTVESDITASDTSLDLVNSKALSDNGSVRIEEDVISYTGNTRSTGTLTGATDVDNNHAAGAYVFQQATTGVPVVYTISSRGKIRLWPIPDSASTNLEVRISYYKTLPTINSLGDTIVLTDTSPAVQYLAYRIKKFQQGGTVNPADEDVQLAFQALTRLVDEDVGASGMRIRVR